MPFWQPSRKRHAAPSAYGRDVAALDIASGRSPWQGSGRPQAVAFQKFWSTPVQAAPQELYLHAPALEAAIQESLGPGPEKPGAFAFVALRSVDRIPEFPGNLPGVDFGTSR